MRRLKILKLMILPYMLREMRMLEISRAMRMLKIWWSLISIPRSAVQAEQIGMEVMEVIRDIKMPGWAVKKELPLLATHLIQRRKSNFLPSYLTFRELFDFQGVIWLLAAFDF